MKKHQKTIAGVVVSLAMILLFILGMALGGIGYFEIMPAEKSCASCHEMNVSHLRWRESAHRNFSCKECHGGSADSWHVLRENIRRVFQHVTAEQHADIKLTEGQLLHLMGKCQTCHQKEYTYWNQGGHGTTYQHIFMDESHNTQECLADQCLQCHGMFYQGSISDLVTPLDIRGPWRFNNPAMAEKPVIPCMACHELHAPGEPFKAVAADTQGYNPPYKRDTLSFYIRAEKSHFALSDLPTKSIEQQGRSIKVSNDPRQRLCTQCHAPNAFGHAGSSDDKTPTGVHEGLSCAACHAPHSNDTRSSCGVCHQQRSSCGINVTAMDTTYRSPNSKHDIHHLACADCHPDK